MCTCIRKKPDWLKKQQKREVARVWTRMNWRVVMNMKTITLTQRTAALIWLARTMTLNT
jgi:hypothetical protein